ncbi:MAG: DNA primase small subunit PriS, partial [Candidatus Bathyarchaeia archaeon]
RELAVVRAAFAEYYREAAGSVEPPIAVAQREFGFLMFPQKVMVRHRAFKEADEVRGFIAENVPSDCFYSSAYYSEPARDMDEKGWLGADLIFDIDADHLVTECKKLHDRWCCQDCQNEGIGGAPETCPRCGSQRFREETWFCEQCLNAAKRETVKLMDFLEGDLGLSHTEIQVYFSGHRGYHLHVESPAVREMDQLARKEIVDYVSATGLTFDYHIRESKPRRQLTRPSIKLPGGWGARLLEAARALVENATEPSLRNMGMRADMATRLLKQRELLLRALDEGAGWQSVRGIGVETWLTILKIASGEQAAHVDSVVTTDVHRLIRIAGTLHGKTGLKKAPVGPGGLDAFDPLKSSVVFREDEPLKVHVENAQQFRLADRTFGPFKRSTLELPKAAAILLLLKGAASLA